MGQNAGARAGFVQRFFTYAAADPGGAGADMAETPIFQVPDGGCKITKVRVLPLANSAGIDGDNTSVFTLNGGVAGTAFATLTQVTDFVANTAVNATITASAAELTGGTIVTLTIANGAAANLGGITLVQVEWTTDGLQMKV